MGIKNFFFKFLLSLTFMGGFQLTLGSLHYLIHLDKDLRYIQNKFSSYEKLSLSTDHDLKEGLLYFRKIVKKPTEKNKDTIWLFCDLLTSIYDSKKSIQNFSFYVENLTQCSEEKFHHIENVKNLLTKISYISVLEKVQENRCLIKKCFITHPEKNYGSLCYKTRDLDLQNLRQTLKSVKFDLYKFAKEKLSLLEKKKKYINNILIHMDFLIKNEKETFHESSIHLESLDTQPSLFFRDEKYLDTQISLFFCDEK